MKQVCRRFDMRNALIIIILLFVINPFTNRALAQLSKGGTPLSFDLELKEIYQEISVNPPAPDELWGSEQYQDKISLPHPFARIIPLELSPGNAGTWTYLPGGGRVWRLKISAQYALATGLYFTKFYLPEGSRLFLYTTDRKQILGAYTSLNNRNNGLFATELTRGDEVVIEMDLPAGIKHEPEFVITGMDYAFRSVSWNDKNPLLKSSGDCEVDINCSPEGDLWQEVKKGIVRIKVRIGSSSFWCSGSLVNNTNFDLTPYILTADHCAFKSHYATDQDLAQWVFYFNYETTQCDGNEQSPDNFSMTGALKIAHGGNQGTTGSDFYLIRLLQDIPPIELGKVYFNGWSRYNDPSEAGVTIHHPAGDFKKISTYNSPLVSSDWFNSGLLSHWLVTWSETTNGWGVTEGGSSGCPLFDQQGRIRGTLTGGQASCDDTELPDYFGKFSWHWDANGDTDSLQLQPWLDPANTGQYILGGYYYNDTAEMPVLTEDLVIKPTLAKDVLNFEFINNPNPEFSVKILSQQGQLIRTATLQASENMYKDFNISDLAVGLYIVEVTFNGNTYTRKIVVR